MSTDPTEDLDAPESGFLLGFRKRLAGFLYGTGVQRPAMPSEKKTIGASGTPIVGGYVVQTEKSSKLIGPQRYVTFDEYKANVAVIGTGIRYCLTLFEGITWSVMPDHDLPGGKDAKTQEIADALNVDLKLMDPSLAKVGRRQALSKFDGLAIQEWVAGKKLDGSLGIAKCEVRPPGTITKWDRDPKTNEIVGVIQTDPMDGTEHYLPRERLIYSVDDQLSDSPIGTGLMRHAVTDARTMGVYENDERIGYQTDMRGLPIGRAPLGQLRQLFLDGDMTEPEYNLRIQAIREILDNHVKTGNLSVLLDSATYTDPDGSPTNIYKYGLELVRGDQGSKYDAIDRAIERRELRLARLFGIEHLFVGTSSKGGYSQSKDRSKSFGQMVNSLALGIADDLLRDLVRPLLVLKGFPIDAPVKVQPDATNLRDVIETIDGLWKMSQSGAIITPDDPVINFIRKMLGVPPAPEMTDEMHTAILQTQGALPPAPPPLDPNKVDEQGNLRKPPQAPPGAAKPVVAKAVDDDALRIVKAGKGVFVGIFPPDAVAKKLSITGGADATALHATLCYLGKGMSEDDVTRLLRVVAAFAKTAPAPSIKVTGCARFDVGAHVVLLAGLGDLRDELAEYLVAKSFKVADDYDFTAHITLAYEDKQATTYERQILMEKTCERAKLGLSWEAGTLVVASGIERVEIQFGA